MNKFWRFRAVIAISMLALNLGLVQAQDKSDKTIKGSGTVGRIPKMIETDVIGDSVMTELNGNIALDQNGEAVVKLPEWFQALNKDFRYSLTAIGAPAPNLYIAEEVADNCFKIAGGAPGMRVSWQVTGIRQDPYANKRRIIVEEEKPDRERNHYLHPELYNQPEEKSIDWARNPSLMRQMKEQRKQK